MKRTLLSIALLSAVSANQAFAEEPSFSYIEGGYSEHEEFTGFVIRGSAELSDNFYLTGSYNDLTDDESLSVDIDYTFQTLGVGFKTLVAESSALYIELNYLDAEVELQQFSDSEDGHKAAIGVRSMLTDTTELYGELANLELTDTATQVTFGARQYLTDNLGVFAEYSRDDFDTDSYSLGVSYKF